MKRHNLRKTALLIVLVILFSTATQVFAAEPRATNYIESQGRGITRETGNTLLIRFSVCANRIMDQIGVYYIQIQRSSDQQSWTTDRTLHYTSYSDWVVENACSNLGSISYTGTSGYYYRARIGFMGKIDGDSEYTYMYTNVVYIP